MSIQLLRQARVWISTVESGFTPENTQELLVQDDLTFSQSASSTDITVEEAGPKPTRGSKRFNDSLDPADWSFSTYLLPYLDSVSGKVLTPDYLLWHGLSSGKELDLSTKGGVSNNATNLMVDFKDNAMHELAMIYIYILMDKVWFKIHKCQVNQAEIQVDISDIGRTAWSGNGTKVEKLRVEPFDPKVIRISEQLYQQLQGSYIKNKLTILEISDVESGKAYNVPITGGSFTINNNITYLTPNTLSRVDIPIGSFTGSFELTGSLTAYFNDQVDGSAELYEDLLYQLSAVNKFKIALILGGRYATGKPAVILVADNAQIGIPSIETEDVLGTSIEFKAIPTELDAGDEGFLSMGPTFTNVTIDNAIATGDAEAAPISVSSVSLDSSTLDLGVGTIETLLATVLPVDAANKSINWMSSDDTVVIVTSTGLTTATVEGMSIGTSTVTVTTVDGSHTATCEVTVS